MVLRRPSTRIIFSSALIVPFTARLVLFSPILVVASYGTLTALFLRPEFATLIT